MPEPFCYRYPHPAVQVDAALLSPIEGRLHVLLIRRSTPPYEGCWAFPGGYMEIDETLEQAVARELQEETGLSDIPLRQAAAFSRIDRDPRERAVSVAFYALVDADRVQPQTSNEASAVTWFAADQPPALGFDHADILATVLARLRTDLADPRLSAQILPAGATPATLKAILDMLG